jgi:hypothetical protein
MDGMIVFMWLEEAMLSKANFSSKSEIPDLKDEKHQESGIMLYFLQKDIFTVNQTRIHIFCLV